jgi:hypothetical protein
MEDSNSCVIVHHSQVISQIIRPKYLNIGNSLYVEGIEHLLQLSFKL